MERGLIGISYVGYSRDRITNSNCCPDTDYTGGEKKHEVEQRQVNKVLRSSLRTSQDS